jgi:hypothetical protein
LELPEGPAYNEPVSFGTPLFDIKWDANKGATNAGSQSSLNIIAKPNDKTSVQNVDGFGYVANFNNDIHNGTYGDGWYRIDYTNDEDFKNKLRDGFTCEIVCVSNFDQGQFWMRPFSTNKWGIMLKDGPEKKWVAFAQATDNSWGAYGVSQNNGYVVYSESRGITKHASFTHLVYVYDAHTKEWGTFVDANYNGGKPENNFDVGSIMNVNGMPYMDREETAHGWNGKVAMVRIYDEAYTQDQIIKRRQELQSTIDKLNTLIAE